MLHFQTGQPGRSTPPGRRHVTSAVLLSVALGGCATAQRPDPLEPMNRKVFAFNEGVDKAVLKPVATAYKAVVPEPVRSGVSHAFSNLADPWSAVNLLLQGRPEDSARDLARFATNSVVGVLGFMDVATGWGLPRHGEDFGKTLGAWGVEPGAYLMLPLLGPSDFRDAAALPIDSLGSFQSHVVSVPLRNSLTAAQFVSRRATLLPAANLLDDVAFDKYSFLRDLYLQRRRRPGSDKSPDPVPDAAPDPGDTDAR